MKGRGVAVRWLRRLDGLKNEMETRPMKFSRGLVLAGLLAVLPGWAMAADIDGSTLSVLWGVPFARSFAVISDSNRSMW